MNSQLPSSGEHESNEIIPEEHRLNNTMKLRLIEYYHPFNELLQKFIEGK
jgi:hypothetical protein